MLPRIRTAHRLALLSLVTACGDDPATEAPRLALAQLQLKGTHNSYHKLDAPPADPALDYYHEPLTTQLDDEAVRHFELDAHLDPDGKTARVYHIAIIDPGTQCDTLDDCLRELRTWSDAHPRHLPIVIFLEAKSDLAEIGGCCGPDGDPSTCDFEGLGERCWDGALDLIDTTFETAWPTRLFSPDNIPLAAGASPRSALPDLDTLRGQLICVLNDGGSLRDEYRRQQNARDDLAGRACFVTADPTDADAVFIKRDDPTCDNGAGPGCDIESLVAGGYLVRTRADTDAVPDPARAARAMASGAHFISTDFPAARPGKDFFFDLPGGVPARCNPVSGTPSDGSRPACEPSLVSE